MQELKRQLTCVPGLNAEDFDISPTGELILSPGVVSVTSSTDDGYNNGDVSALRKNLTGAPQRAAHTIEHFQQQVAERLYIC